MWILSHALVEMTIGLAAYGPNAGLAVYRGVLAAALLGRGAIGGFAVFSVLGPAGAHAHRQIEGQDGGIEALVGADALFQADCAAAISSGPNRPTPLGQFLVADPAAGLVTGHRLPNRKGCDGLPVNMAALHALRGGAGPQEAVSVQAERNPELDFGLIAVSHSGTIGWVNSPRVERRGDLLRATREGRGRGFALLGNSIFCASGLQLDTAIGDVVWSCLTGQPGTFTIASLAGPIPIAAAAEDAIEIDDGGRLLRIATAEPATAADTARTTVAYSRAPVVRNGRIIGRCASELTARVENGLVRPLAGLPRHIAIERADAVAA